MDVKFGFLREKGMKNILALELDDLRRLARLPRRQKISNTTIRSKMKAEQSILDRIQRRKTEVVWRRFTSWHRRLGGEEEGRNKVTDFMRGRNMEEDKHYGAWEWVDGGS